MKLSECGFRDLYRKCILLKGDRLFSDSKKLLEDYSCHVPPEANALLCYCYVDAQSGTSFEFLCFANSDTGELYASGFGNPLSERPRLTFRYDAVQNDDAFLFEEDIDFFTEYRSTIDRGFHKDEEILRIRELPALDPLRYITNPDDIHVLLAKDGLPTEQVWVKLTGFSHPHFSGILLNEPNTDFGVHRHDIVQVTVLARKNELFAVCVLPKRLA